MKYNIIIQEILQKIIEVEANTESEALDKVENMYYKSEVVLTGDNYSEVSFFREESEEIDPDEDVLGVKQMGER